jgi:renalase
MQAKRIAVVGAGLSGLAAAFRLGEVGFEVSVLEKSRGLSGRAASRTRHGCRYDIGANYFKVESNELARLLFQTLPTEGLRRLVGEIVPFDRDGRFLPPDPGRGGGSRWTYLGGISTLGKLLATTGVFEVRNATRIVRLARTNGGWRLEGEGGLSLEGFDALVLTPPGPQTAELIAASDLPEPLRTDLVAALGRPGYASQFSVALNFEGEFDLPQSAFALINADRGHDLAWVGHENRKPERVPPGESLFVAQLSPEWTQRHYEAPAEEVATHALRRLRELIGIALPEPRWSDVQRWRYALPLGPVATGAIREASGLRLFFAGDALVGRGRVGGALESGLAVAESIRSVLA